MFNILRDKMGLTKKLLVGASVLYGVLGIANCGSNSGNNTARSGKNGSLQEKIMDSVVVPQIETAEYIAQGIEGRIKPVSYKSGRGGPVIPGDFDNDGDIDRCDFANFIECLNGPYGSMGSGCDAGDFDFDNDVDLFDYGEFTRFPIFSFDMTSNTR